MTSLADKAYDLIREKIVAGTISADQAISERSLAESLNLGRTPVREALKELQRDGLLMVVPGRGTFLRQLTLDEVRDIYEVRMGLEGIAAYLAAERGPTPELRTLEPVLHQMLARSDDFTVTQMQEAGWTLHREIFRSTQNQRLIQTYEDLYLQIALALSLTRAHEPGRVKATVAEHLGILEAILSGRAKEAQELIWDHLANALEARVRIFSRFSGHRQNQTNALAGGIPAGTD